uniref:Uncharacterized protein n=1 Tax=Panagrolaimus sp. JU765 TaxID=591449 RepID=A0AC34QKP4_9BILA
MDFDGAIEWAKKNKDTVKRYLREYGSFSQKNVYETPLEQVAASTVNDYINLTIKHSDLEQKLIDAVSEIDLNNTEFLKTLDELMRTDSDVSRETFDYLSLIFMVDMMDISLLANHIEMNALTVDQLNDCLEKFVHWLIFTKALMNKAQPPKKEAAFVAKPKI